MRREFLARLGLAAGGAVLFMLLLEASLRLAGFRPRAYPTLPGFRESLLVYKHPFYPAPPRPSLPRMMYRYKPNSIFYSQYADNPRGYFDGRNRVIYRNNYQGFRDYEFRPRPEPGTYRVAILGDSFSQGGGVRQEDTWPKVLEREMKIACPPAEVYNFSVGGYSSLEELVLLKETVLGYRPDLILVGYVLNDIDHVATDDIGRRLESLRRKLPFFDTRSRAVGFIADRLWTWHVSRETVALYRRLYAPGPLWDRQRAVFKAMKALARSAGARLGVVIFPDLKGLAMRRYPFAGIHGRLHDLFDEEGIPWMDLAETFRAWGPGKLEAHPTDPHPNEVAHRLAAGNAFETLMICPGPR